MNDCDNNSSPFSVDLLKNSKDHISFLNGLHSLGVTLHRPSKKSLERYRDQWLPMVHRCNKRSFSKEEKKIKLIPPPDIAWLFHCHRLAPFHYAKYCRKELRVKKTNNEFLFPDAEAPFSFQLEAGEVHCGTEADSKRTRRRWKKYYPEEPFFLADNGGHEEETKDSLLLNGFDLLGSTERQSSFLWHLSTPHFADDQFLKAGIERYHKFILLRKLQLDDQQNDSTKHPSMIVPTYDIDLMWHTHMLSGLTFYHNDCRMLLGGSTLNHDDGVGEDRSQGGTLDVAFKKTKAIWKHSYGEDYSIPGGMYKGEPPTHFYSKEWSSGSFSSAELLYYAAAAADVQPCMRFVGIEGATSTYQVDEAPLVDDTPRATLVEDAPIQGWTLITETAPDGLPAFQMAADKYSTDCGEIANPFKNKYVFGMKGDSIGYFHITTKEAYEILAERVKIMTKKLESHIAMVESCKCLCSQRSMQQFKDKAEKKLEAMKDVELLAKERAKTRGPGDKVNLPPRFLRDKKHFFWHFDDSYYEAGGGCGYFLSGNGNRGNGNRGNGNSGGGCAFGACAFGACGGDGCGGGACGGGKCLLSGTISLLDRSEVCVIGDLNFY